MRLGCAKETKKVPSGEIVFAWSSGKGSFFLSGCGDGFFSTVKFQNFKVLLWQKSWIYSMKLQWTNNKTLTTKYEIQQCIRHKRHQRFDLKKAGQTTKRDHHNMTNWNIKFSMT